MTSKKGLISEMKSADQPVTWRRKGLVRISLLLIAAAVIAGIAAAFGIARDYGYLRASILTGAPGGQYHTLATRLADRAGREHGSLTVIPTAGSIENVSRLTARGEHCSEMFALVQDGTPVRADTGLELLGRLPEPEVSAPAWKTWPYLSNFFRFARSIDRDRPGRLRHGISHASTLRRLRFAQVINQSISSCTFLLTGRISSDSEGR